MYLQGCPGEEHCSKAGRNMWAPYLQLQDCCTVTASIWRMNVPPRLIFLKCYLVWVGKKIAHNVISSFCAWCKTRCISFLLAYSYSAMKVINHRTSFNNFWVHVSIKCFDCRDMSVAKISIFKNKNGYIFYAGAQLAFPFDIIMLMLLEGSA